MKTNNYPCSRCQANVNNDCTRVCLDYKLWFIPKWEEAVKPFREMLGKENNRLKQPAEDCHDN